MIVASADDVIRVVRALARRADTRLAHGATRNAAAAVRDHDARRLDDARLLHELPQVAPDAASHHRRTGG